MLLSQTIQLMTYFPQAKDFTNLQGVKTHQLFERLHNRSQKDPPGEKVSKRTHYKIVTSGF